MRLSPHNRILGIVWICGLIRLCTGLAHGQESSLEDQEVALLRMEVHFDSLRAVHVQRLEEAETLARLINLTRSRENLSSSEHRILQRRLLESQRLETQVRDLDARIKETGRTLRSAIHTFIQDIQTEILYLVEQMERRGDPNDLDRFQSLLQKKARWETRITPPSIQGPRTLQVMAQSYDSPETIEMKGDLLLDQEEVLRSEIQTVETRIRSLEEEERVRRKVAELTRDIHLFDEREELMGKGIENQARVLSEGTYDTRGHHISPFPDYTASGAYYERIQLVLSGPTPRSPDELNTWILQLKQYRDLIVARADSLRQRANWFYREAETRRE